MPKMAAEDCKVGNALTKEISIHQPAPRRTTWFSPPLNDVSAVSIFESNQRVRTARITPDTSRALLSLSLLIFSWRFLRYFSPASMSATGSWIICFHRALPAAV